MVRLAIGKGKIDGQDTTYETSLASPTFYFAFTLGSLVDWRNGVGCALLLSIYLYI